MRARTYVRTDKGVFKSKVNVVGVSANPVAKQKEFVEKNNLTVRIIYELTAV